MPKRKKQPTVAHKKLAKLLVRARAARALEDPEELDRQAAALFEQYDDATSVQEQRDAGKKSPGRRGQFKVAPADLLAAVQVQHERSPRLTFNDVCGKVSRRFGYKSPWPAKTAARDIKWPDPRRRSS